MSRVWTRCWAQQGGFSASGGGRITVGQPVTPDTTDTPNQNKMRSYTMCIRDITKVPHSFFFSTIKLHTKEVFIRGVPGIANKAPTLLHTCLSHSNLVATLSPITWVPVAVSQEINLPVREADRLQKSSSGVKNEWSYISNASCDLWGVGFN
jgi:hypothetical protein